MDVERGPGGAGQVAQRARGTSTAVRRNSPSNTANSCRAAAAGSSVGATAGTGAGASRGAGGASAAGQSAKSAIFERRAGFATSSPLSNTRRMLPWCASQKQRMKVAGQSSSGAPSRAGAQTGTGGEEGHVSG